MEERSQPDGADATDSNEAVNEDWQSKSSSSSSIPQTNANEQKSISLPKEITADSNLSLRSISSEEDRELTPNLTRNQFTFSRLKVVVENRAGKEIMC